MRLKAALLMVPLVGLALTAQQPAPAQAPAPPPVPSCPELATALVNLGRNDARLRDWPALGTLSRAEPRARGASGERVEGRVHGRLDHRCLAAPGRVLLRR